MAEGHTPELQAPSDPQLLRERAEAVLRDNDLGTMITAAPRLYPHMWSWDAAFVAMGLTRLSVPRAVQEMRMRACLASTGAANSASIACTSCFNAWSDVVVV